MSELIRKRCKRFMYKPLEEYVDDETKLTLHGLKQYSVNRAETENELQVERSSRQLGLHICQIRDPHSATRSDSQGHQLPSLVIHAHMTQEACMGHFQDVKDFKSRVVAWTSLGSMS